tara:strand:+ start:228 stop:509 length:282 start_codon:yes stop_codon:yes gene_type:complete
MILRKIPLGPFIELLTDLFDNGADFIDLEGDENNEGDAPRDSLKITVKPEYLSLEDDEDDEIQESSQEIRMNFSINDNENTSSLSEDDIEDLI